MPVKVELLTIKINLDALELTDEIATKLGAYYARAMLAGRRPEGGALPTNKQGKPIGVGNGTVATNWVTTPARGTRSAASSSTAPYQEGGYEFAVRSMAEKGASPVSAEGKAGSLIGAIVDKHAARSVE